MSKRLDLKIVADTREFDDAVNRAIKRVRRDVRRHHRRSYMRDRMIGFAFGVFATGVCVLAGWLIASFA